MGTTAFTGSPRVRVIRSVKQWIADGVLPRGEVFPSERLLSEKLSVSRDTVRRAIRELEQDGVIRGDGTGSRMVVGTGIDKTGPGWLQNAVAVIAPEIEFSPSHREPRWGEYLLYGVIREISASGQHAVTLHPNLLGEAEVGRLLEHPPLGVILPEFFFDSKVFQANDLIPRFVAAGVPVVAYGDSPELQEVDRVTSDHEVGSYDVTRWLIKKGRTRVLPVWFGPRNYYWCLARRRGYERAMREAGLDALDTLWMTPLPFMESTAGNFHVLSTYIAGHLVKHFTGPQPPDAIVALTDGEVPYIAAACRSFGKTPNRDVLLVGYDNYSADMPELEMHFESVGPMATVDKRSYEMGQAMVQLLMERVARRLPDEPQRRVIAPTLVVPVEKISSL